MPKLHILFLCVANSARSQLAEGLAKSIFKEQAVIASAGSQPSGLVQPWAIEVLKEDKIDISSNKSKSIEDLPFDFLQKLDFVITLCAEEICPLLQTQAKRLHWPIQDPTTAHEAVIQNEFRRAKQEIRTRIEELAKTTSKILSK